MTPTQRAAMQSALDDIVLLGRMANIDHAERPSCAALRACLAEPVQEPVYWQWRWYDASPYTVTSGQWTEWEMVKPRNSLCTVADSVKEFEAYIARGQRYELRQLFTTPPDTTALLEKERQARIAAQIENEGLKAKLVASGVAERRKYHPLLRQALEALEHRYIFGALRAEAIITIRKHLGSQ